MPKEESPFFARHELLIDGSLFNCFQEINLLPTMKNQKGESSFSL